MSGLAIALLALNLVVILALGGYAVVLLRRRGGDGAPEVQRQLTAAEATNAHLESQLNKSEADFVALRQELDTEMKSRVKAETELAEIVKSFAEQKRLLSEAEKKLTDTFKALSSDALRQNNQSFAEQAKALVKPLSESLKQYEEHVRSLETARQGAYAKIEEQLRGLSMAERELQKETGNLVTALRNPQVRGRWGEVTLHRVIELAGMSEHCDYTEQITVQSEEGRLRPDLVVHLPAGRTIVVDSKVSLEAYLSAIAAQTEEERQQYLTDHAQQVRNHVKRLSKKAYWDQFDQAPEFVVMFIPGECFFSAALECDRALIEDAAGDRVVLATPTTLIALLRSVAYGWRQESMAESAREISDLGRQLYDRLTTFCNHLSDVGRNLTRANNSYNQAVGSLESRVLPAARRFEDLKVTGDDTLSDLSPIETVPRPLTAPEAGQVDETEGPEENQDVATEES